MVAARSGRELAGFQYDEIINAIDWNRVLIQAYGLHKQLHAKNTAYDVTCGECIRSVLLRHDDLEPTISLDPSIPYKIVRKILDMPETKLQGVWATYQYDGAYILIETLHLEEIDALRKAIDVGYLTVVYVPFGMGLRDAIQEYETAKEQARQ